jgi:FecR protein
MKKLLPFSTGYARLSLICAALLLAAGCSWQLHVAGGAESSAKVVRLKGAARYATGSNAGRLLKVGDTLKPGAVIQTAEQSSLDLVLRGDSSSPQAGAQQDLVRLWENSLLGIDMLTRTQTGSNVVEETQLDLKAGHLYGVVKKLRGASRYEVRLPNGVAGTRGAVYDISAECAVKVWSGSVVLGYVRPGGTVETQVIAESQQFDAVTAKLSSLSEAAKPALAAEGP